MIKYDSESGRFEDRSDLLLTQVNEEFEDESNGFTFHYKAGSFETSLRCDVDSGTDEVCENVINFLYSCGFSLNSIISAFSEKAQVIDRLEFDGKVLGSGE